MIAVTEDPAMQRARKRARDLRDFYGHLVTYVAVCGLLVVIDLLDGSHGTEFIGLNWAYWPLIGWGVFVFVHALSVIFPMNTWEERKVEELYEKEKQRELEHMGR